jgi:hypothetical protein
MIQLISWLSFLHKKSKTLRRNVAEWIFELKLNAYLFGSDGKLKSNLQWPNVTKKEKFHFVH